MYDYWEVKYFSLFSAKAGENGWETLRITGINRHKPALTGIKNIFLFSPDLSKEFKAVLSSLAGLLQARVAIPSAKALGYYQQSGFLIFAHPVNPVSILISKYTEAHRNPPDFA